jgi:hypothetical protein
MKNATIRLLLANWILTILVLASCSADDEISPLGKSYGLQKTGGGMPHAPFAISILHKKDTKEWEVVWPAIYFTSGGPQALGETVLFSAYINRNADRSTPPRILVYGDSKVVVDVTDEIIRVLNSANLFSFQIKKGSSEDSVIIRDLNQSVERNFSEKELNEMASRIIAKQQKRTLNEVTFYE